MADISGYLNNIRTAESGETVRDSIIQCLNKINNDNPTQVKPLNVTANGTYSSDTGIAYNPVTVNVPAGGSSGYSFKELVVDENGEYEPEEENEMFNKVTVNVPQLATDIMQDTYEITENGEYDPLLDGYDGYGKIVVNVQGGGGDGPFLVEFYDTDHTTKLYSEYVEKFGNANFQGTLPVSGTGERFVGWNPSPLGVTRDLKCYPYFKDISYDPTEIQDGWDTILMNRGAGYPIGAHKFLAYGATWTADEIKTYINPSYAGDSVAVNLYMMMYKVAEGEGGTTSSWLSSRVSFSNNYIPQFASWGEVADNRGIRGALNNCFFNHMADGFKATIKPVTKYTLDTHNMIIPTEDKIWIAGIKEVGTYKTGYDETGYYDYINQNTWSDSNTYWTNVQKLASSMGYVMDYGNNDRNLALNFIKDYQNNYGLTATRDSFDKTGSPYNFVRGYYSNVINMYNMIADPNVNIGFCL